MTGILASVLPWIVAAFAGVSVAIGAWWHGRATGARDAADRDLARETRTAAVVGEQLARSDAASAAQRATEDAAVQARVVDPSAPTRAEVDAALEREERMP